MTAQTRSSEEEFRSLLRQQILAFLASAARVCQDQRRGRVYGNDYVSDEGRELLQSALNKSFNPEATNYYLASSYQREGELATALRLYAAVTDANPVNAFALLEIGTILHQTGKAEEAEPYFRRVIELNPALAKSRLGTSN